MWLYHVSKSDSMGGAMDAMELGRSSNGFERLRTEMDGSYGDFSNGKLMEYSWDKYDMILVL